MTLMYHTLEFTTDVGVDLEVSAKQPLEQVRIERGSRLRAELKPYVVETKSGLIEVADLYFEDGRIARRMPFSRFMLVD